MTITGVHVSRKTSVGAEVRWRPDRVTVTWRIDESRGLVRVVMGGEVARSANGEL